MKKTVTLILFILFLSCEKNEDFGEPELAEFQVILDESTGLGQSDITVVEADNGGVVALGCHYKDYGTEKSQVNLYVVKTDATGQIEWEKSFGGNGFDYGKCIVKIDDGYLLLGTKTVNESVQNPYLICIDKSGKEKWSKVISYISDSAYGGYIIPISGNNFLICGTITLNGVDKPYLLKVDQKGEKIWLKEYDLIKENLIGMKVSKNVNNTGYIVLALKGYACVNGKSLLFEVDNNGNLIWKTDFENKCYYSFVCNENDYTFTGQTTYTQEFLVSNIDLDGKEIWSKTYKFGKYYGALGRSIRKDRDGNYIVTGRTGYQIYAQMEHMSFYVDFCMLLTKLNLNGDTLWSRNIDTQNATDYGLSIEIKRGGGFLIGGVSGPSINPGLDNPIYILSTDSLGMINGK
jgi:hypothetical protein